jgi:hypothetical protein
VKEGRPLIVPKKKPNEDIVLFASLETEEASVGSTVVLSDDPGFPAGRIPPTPENRPEPEGEKAAD